MARFQISVNGRQRAVDAPDETSLLDVLREDLQLTGTKYGCGIGQCGACVVLVDDEPVPACKVSLAEVRGRAITTIEGMAAGPVVDAFIAEGALQCGYCTPGMVVETAALLAKSPDPTEDEIRAALDRHLCRCGVHLRVIRAVRRAAKGAR